MACPYLVSPDVCLLLPLERSFQTFPHQLGVGEILPRCRRGRIPVRQHFVREPGDQSLLAGVLPVRELTALDTEIDRLAGLIDGVGAEMGKRALRNSLVLVSRTGVAVVRGKRSAVHNAHDLQRVSSVGREYERADGVGAKNGNLSPVSLDAVIEQ